MNHMFHRTVALVALLSLFLAGCGDSKAGGRIVTKSKIVGNVVSLSPSTTQLVGENGGATFLAGRTESCDRPRQVDILPVVVKGTKPDYEAIKLLDADLIVYEKALYSDDEITKIKALNVETMEYNVHNLDEYTDYCYRVGSTLGIEMQMSSYVDRIRKAESLARSVTTSKPTVMVLLGEQEQGYLVMGTSRFQAELIKICGGVPVGVNGDNFVPANLERIVEINPDVIYCPVAKSIYDDPRLQTIKAVKNQRVYEFEERHLVRMSSKIDDAMDKISKDLKFLALNPRGTSK